MKRIVQKFWDEPVFAMQIPTIVFATAAGIWSAEWLAFVAAVAAGIGAILGRANVTPINNGR
jgi:hypothetical protein